MKQEYKLKNYLLYIFGFFLLFLNSMKHNSDKLRRLRNASAEVGKISIRGENKNIKMKRVHRVTSQIALPMRVSGPDVLFFSVCHGY